MDERVLDAVLDEVAISGLAKLSMDRVARRAGVSKTTVYTRWHTKGALILAAFRHVSRGFPPIDSGSLRGDLDLLWEVFRTASENRRLVVPLTELTAAAATNDDLRAVQHRYHGGWRAGIRGILAAAQARGELEEDVDIELTAELLQSMCTWRALIDPPVDDSLRARVEQLVLHSPPRR